MVIYKDMNINSIKRYVGDSIKGVAKNYQSRMDVKRKKMDEEVQSMGYRGIDQVNDMNPDMPKEDMLTRGVKKVIRKIKRYRK